MIRVVFFLSMFSACLLFTSLQIMDISLSLSKLRLQKNDCVHDADCNSHEWCRKSQYDTFACVKYAEFNQTCETSTIPRLSEKCYPEMFCDISQDIPDLAGICKCAGDLQWHSCGTACEHICGEPEPQFCIKLCVPACQCPSGKHIRTSPNSTVCVEDVLQCNSI